MILYISFSLILFFIGSCGVYLSRKNLIMVVMSFELMLLSVNLNFIFASTYLDDLLGQVYILYILSIAGVESAIGLALIIAYHKKYRYI